MGQTSEAIRQSVRLVMGDETVIPVLGYRFVIGRSPSCQLRPMNQLVSRRHAAIEDEGDTFILRDLDSRNGTLRNGRLVTGSVHLRDGDRIQVGPLSFTVSIRPIEDAPDEPSSTEDQVASWLIDGPDSPCTDSDSNADSDPGNSGGVTHVGAPQPEKRKSLRPL